MSETVGKFVRRKVIVTVTVNIASTDLLVCGTIGMCEATVKSKGNDWRSLEAAREQAILRLIEQVTELQVPDPPEKEGDHDS